MNAHRTMIDAQLLLQLAQAIADDIKEDGITLEIEIAGKTIPVAIRVKP